MISCRVRRPGRPVGVGGWLLLTLGVGSLVAACSNKDPDPGATTLPRATTTSTLDDADRYAIPDTITAEYVNDVLVALNHVYGDVFRRYLATGTLEPTDLAELRSVFYDAELDEQGAALARTPRLAPEKYAEPIGDRQIKVERLLTTRRDCIAVEATYDFSAVLKEPPPQGRGWLSLRNKEQGSDPMRRNPTPWSIATESLTTENRCESL